MRGSTLRPWSEVQPITVATNHKTPITIVINCILMQPCRKMIEDCFEFYVIHANLYAHNGISQTRINFPFAIASFFFHVLTQWCNILYTKIQQLVV